jgi:hypothetical protein
MLTGLKKYRFLSNKLNMKLRVVIGALSVPLFVREITANP